MPRHAELRLPLPRLLPCPSSVPVLVSTRARTHDAAAAAPRPASLPSRAPPPSCCRPRPPSPATVRPRASCPRATDTPLLAMSCHAREVLDQIAARCWASPGHPFVLLFRRWGRGFTLRRCQTRCVSDHHRTATTTPCSLSSSAHQRTNNRLWWPPSCASTRYCIGTSARCLFPSP